MDDLELGRVLKGGGNSTHSRCGFSVSLASSLPSPMPHGVSWAVNPAAPGEWADFELVMRVECCTALDFLTPEVIRHSWSLTLVIGDGGEEVQAGQAVMGKVVMAGFTVLPPPLVIPLQAGYICLQLFGLWEEPGRPCPPRVMPGSPMGHRRPHSSYSLLTCSLRGSDFKPQAVGYP